MKYLREFETEAEYQDYINSDELILPNVSYIQDIGGVHYNTATPQKEYKAYIPVKKTTSDMSGLTYNMVDLGLPSGLLWADRNVGATSQEDLGVSFAWGETEGYGVVKSEFTAQEFCDILQPLIDGGDVELTLTPDNLDDVLIMMLDVSPLEFSRDLTGFGVILPLINIQNDWNAYFDTNDGGETFNKYALDKLTVLQPEDDAAFVNMGNNCRMPTPDEVRELLDNCYYETDDWDIIPYKFTSKINGNSIIIPPPLTTYDYEMGIDSSYDRIWTSYLYGPSYNDKSQKGRTGLIFNSSAGGYDEYRKVGLPVRGVCSK